MERKARNGRGDLLGGGCGAPRGARGGGQFTWCGRWRPPRLLLLRLRRRRLLRLRLLMRLLLLLLLRLLLLLLLVVVVMVMVMVSFERRQLLKRILTARLPDS